MKRSSLVLATMLVSAALPAVASAHVVDAQTRVSIGRTPQGVVPPGTRVVVSGRLHSAARAVCTGRKVIRLYLVRRGPDRLLARDVTDAQGGYRFVRRPRADVRVYARFAASFASSYGHQHTCRSDSSRAILIDVRRR